MSDTLNTVLGQLEEDLKKLQSAREQVESVVASNQEFVMVVNSLVENTNLLVDKMRTATEDAIGTFSEKLTESKNAVGKVVEDGVNSLQSSVKKMEEGNLELQDTTEMKVNEVSKLASNAISKNVTQSLETIKDTSNLAIEYLEKQQNEFAAAVNSLVDTMRTATEDIIENFSEKLTESKNTIDKVAKDGVSHIQSSVKKMEENNLKLQDTVETKVDEVSKLASNVLDKNAIQSLETIKYTSSLALKSLEEQRGENLKTLNQILETHNQIKQLIGQLLALDLPNTLKALNSNIKKQQQQSDRQFQTIKRMQMWSLIGAGVLAIIITVFKFVL
jgi:hypothetical protein